MEEIRQCYDELIIERDMIRFRLLVGLEMSYVSCLYYKDFFIKKEERVFDLYAFEKEISFVF